MTKTFSSFPMNTARPELNGSTVRISTGMTGLLMAPECRVSRSGCRGGKLVGVSGIIPVGGPADHVETTLENIAKRRLQWWRAFLLSARMKQPWDIPAAISLYNIDRWGTGYFTINERGNIQVQPTRGE